jgi:glutamyl/glutaminyl-tRNA synthetase
MNKFQTFKKTRLAPTPSGYLHLGNILSFLITTSLAKKHQAKVLLRIDDLDGNRVKDEYINDIFETLHFLEIPWDEGPKDVAEFKSKYSQKCRIDLYEEALKELASNGDCFACVCSRKTLSESMGYPGNCKIRQIDLNTKGVCWRLRTEPDDAMSVKIYPNQLISTPFPTEMKDFVARKKDGFPAYQLSSVVDDIHFGVDLVVRGSDLWNSTLAQIRLAPQLQGGSAFLETVFFHHQLMENEGIKLSKSSGSTSIQFLRKNGAKKETIYRLLSGFLTFPAAATNFVEFSDYYLREISQQ